VQAKNQADASLHSVKKSLTEYGDKLEGEEKAKIETAVKELEDALKGDDKALIDEKSTALMTGSQKLGEHMYADAQAKEAAQGGGAEGGPSAEHASAHEADDNVVDAEVKEVKEVKKD
jgi:molecular chaperone DnaK